jgi:hypothetical protein
LLPRRGVEFFLLCQKWTRHLDAHIVTAFAFAKTGDKGRASVEERQTGLEERRVGLYKRGAGF